MDVSSPLRPKQFTVSEPTPTIRRTVAHEIFEAKERPRFDPLIVHVPDVRSLTEVVSSVPPLAQRLIEAFWPGPLTLVLAKSGSDSRSRDGRSAHGWRADPRASLGARSLAARERADRGPECESVRPRQPNHGSTCCRATGRADRLHLRRRAVLGRSRVDDPRRFGRSPDVVAARRLGG